MIIEFVFSRAYVKVTNELYTDVSSKVNYRRSAPKNKKKLMFSVTRATIYELLI